MNAVCADARSNAPITALMVAIAAARKRDSRSSWNRNGRLGGACFIEGLSERGPHFRHLPGRTSPGHDDLVDAVARWGLLKMMEHSI